MARVFLSYAHHELDRAVARRLYDDLRAAGHSPWLDEVDLRPGDDFELRIEEEIRNCRFFLAIISSHSLSKRGFVQRELRLALDVLDLMPVDERFLLPLRLDECYPRHPRLRRLHWTDLFPDYTQGLKRLLSGLVGSPQTGGTLYAQRGLQIPSGLASWDEEPFCRFVKTELMAEAWLRAERDYMNVEVGDRTAAIRDQSRMLLCEVARRHHFEDRLHRCLGWECPEESPRE